MELFLSDKVNQAFSNLTLVLIDYLNLNTVVKVSNSTDESRKSNGVTEETHFLKLENSSVETNAVNILELITKQSPFHKVLFGKDQDETNLVYTFIKDISNYTNVEFSNNYLQSRTYTINQHITICDIWLYINLIGNLKKFSDKEMSQYCNLSRYADFIQHLPGLEEALSKRGLTFSLAIEPKWNNLNESATANADGKKKSKREDKLKAKEEYFKKQEESKKTEGNNNNQNIEINTNPTEVVKKTENKEKKPKEETKKEDNKAQNQSKKEDKKPDAKKAQQPKKAAEGGDEMPAVSKLDIRVGKIVKIYPNEESDKLYNEEIDIGNGEIRTIASGLKKRIPIDVLKDSYVIVLCNLKGRKLCNYFSHGMVNSR